HGAGDRPDEDGDAVDETGVRRRPAIGDDRRGVGGEAHVILLEALHGRPVLEHDDLAVGLASQLGPDRPLGDVRVADVLTALVDDAAAVGAAGTQAAPCDLRVAYLLTALVDDAAAVGAAETQSALGDLREDGNTMTLLGERLDAGIDLVPLIALGLPRVDDGV